MFGRNTSARNRHKFDCAECGAVLTRRDLKRAQSKHRDPNTGLVVMETWCPNCNHRIDTYHNEEENRRTNKYGVGWSPPG